MDEQEKEEILYRLDERTKRVDDHLGRLDRRVRRNDSKIDELDSKVSSNKIDIQYGKGILGALVTLASASAAKVFGLLGF